MPMTAQDPKVWNQAISIPAAPQDRRANLGKRGTGPPSAPCTPWPASGGIYRRRARRASELAGHEGYTTWQAPPATYVSSPASRSAIAARCCFGHDMSGSAWQAAPPGLDFHPAWVQAKLPKEGIAGIRRHE
jgi:hypothetical protein